LPWSSVDAQHTPPVVSMTGHKTPSDLKDAAKRLDGVALRAKQA
jgi:hypothetical protein